ncbi:MAG TPA: DUF1501 domain-containing protein [Thermoanaerobaculia bacterium]|jgi:uncharacterized protein (DUF1501 family)|nr:DUF1501 domain-containing protein [Thermoanaerobaculia bacterium]
MSFSRRDFLRTSVCAAVGTTSIVRTLLDLGGIAAAAELPRRHSVVRTAADYKALVCVFMYGGNDGNNIIVPRTGSDYTQYAAGRGSVALPQNVLLPITPTMSDGRVWGLHPSMTGLQGLFGQHKMALLANVGPLLAPLTRDQFLNGSVAAPPQLFSHSDQQVHWQTSIPDQPPHTGWGGRTADLLRTLNGNAQVSMSMSLAGSNVYQVGDIVTQYQVSPAGTIGLDNFTDGPNGDPVSLAIRSLLTNQTNNLLVGAAGAVTKRALDNNALLQSALDQAPALTTVFPDSYLGGQLNMVAKLISVRAALGLSRQVFFVATDGFDTHGDQLASQAGLLDDLSASLTAFYNATVELTVASNVTTFTASDFGRTFPGNGSGTDHGWGSHQIIVGGAVQGGNIYGHVPTLVTEGPDDSGEGRWIPTTSVDEYSATLARWFGVGTADMGTIFPNLGRFNNPNLGFMG